jgi:membrane protein DedA with SNARE-associated domain/membrane-associated phospholipid phosphatase
MKPVWFAAAALLICLLAWRRRRMEPPLLIGGALVAIAMVVYGTGAVHLPSLDKLLEDVGRTLGAWTYLLVALLAFAESGAFVGLIVPGETALIVGGMVAGQGQIDVILLIAIAWTAAVAGDLVSLTLGHRLGRAFLVKHGKKVQITEERIEQVERFYARHGGKAVFLGRFVGLARAVSPFLAGSSGMPLRRFLPYDILAAGILTSVFALLGLVFWRSLDQVIAIAKKGTFALATTIVVLVGLVAAVRWLRVPDNRRRVGDFVDRQAGTPVIGPVIRAGRGLARRAVGPARFVWERLTPGKLGLELTTLLAAAAVGSFVFFGYVIALHPITRHTPGDLRGQHWSVDLQTAWLTHVAKALTNLGMLPVAGGALVVAALVLLARRHRLEGLALLAGLGITVAAVQLAKHAVGRPRPPDPLVHTSGLAYPSGHAAYAVCWIAIALALRHALPGLAPRTAVLVTGIALAAIVGVTRIYLRAHWFSDVAGGWALAATVFALSGIVALVVAFVHGAGARD